MTSTVLADDAPWFTKEVPELPHSFDTNVGILVKELGTTVVVPWLPNVSCWTVDLRSAHTGLQLQVYKERLEESTSTICDQCRIIGKYEARCCHIRLRQHCGTALFSLRRLAEPSCLKAPLSFHSACG